MLAGVSAKVMQQKGVGLTRSAMASVVNNGKTGNMQALMGYAQELMDEVGRRVAVDVRPRPLPTLTNALLLIRTFVAADVVLVPDELLVPWMARVGQLLVTVLDGMGGPVLPVALPAAMAELVFELLACLIAFVSDALYVDAKTVARPLAALRARHAALVAAWTPPQFARLLATLLTVYASDSVTHAQAAAESSAARFGMFFSSLLETSDAQRAWAPLATRAAVVMLLLASDPASTGAVTAGLADLVDAFPGVEDPSLAPKAGQAAAAFPVLYDAIADHIAVVPAEADVPIALLHVLLSRAPAFAGYVNARTDVETLMVPLAHALASPLRALHPHFHSTFL